MQEVPPELAAEALHGALLAAGANPRLASPAWVNLQRSLLLWRLRCLEVSNGLTSGSLLTSTVLTDLLRYRCCV